MKKYLLIFLSSILLFSSCSSAEYSADNDRYILLKGMITDVDNNPLERICVSVKLRNSDKTHSFYTSSEGQFIFELGLEEIDDEITFSLSINDIDGAENGGQFQERNDEITIFEEDYSAFPIRLEIPPYRLNRATVSESNQQF